MKTRVIFILCVAAMVYPAAGQPAEPAVRYVGVVSGTDVYVRSGPNTDAYPCTKVSAPATVQVVEESAEFLKILPTPGTYSVISKKYVSLDATGKVGTITGSSVRARAGGDLCPGKSFADFWFIHRIMDKGDKVQVVGSGGDFYKVTPPARAYFWISKKYVKRGVVVERPGKKTGKGGKGKAKATTKPDGKTPVTPQTAEEVDEINRAFRAAEKLLRAEYKKPAGRRDLQSVVAAFKDIQAPKGGYMREQIDGIVAFLKEVMRREADIEQAKELLDEAAAKQQEYEMARAKVQLDAPAKAAEPRYTAQGVLTASVLFAGGPSGPKRYLLRNVAARRVVGYVQCTTGAVDLAAFEGKEVGVIGTSSYNSRLGTTIIEATKVVPLGGDVDLPTPPKPIVKPYTPPPKPVVTPVPTPAPKVGPDEPVKLESLTDPKPKPKPKRPKKPRPPAKIDPAPTAKTPEPAPKPLPRPKPIVIEPIPEPIVVEPKPVIVESKPVVVDPKPVIVEPKPVVVDPKPAVIKPKPTVVKPVPVVVEPKPVVGEPKPVVVEPKPVVVEPKPVVVEPKPLVVEPKPVVVEPKPVVVEPKPVVVEPKPVVVEPKPIVVEPKPAPAVVKPKVTPKPFVRPAPIILDPPSSDPAVIAPPVKPTVKPAPKAKPIIIEPKPIIFDPKAGPKLKPPSVGKPKPKVPPKPKSAPAKPVKATTRPAATTQPTTRPTTQPATQPATPKPDKPLPPTGLPIVDEDAPDKPAVDEKDYE